MGRAKLYNCPKCNKKFKKLTANQKYCSVECRTLFNEDIKFYKKICQSQDKIFKSCKYCKKVYIEGVTPDEEYRKAGTVFCDSKCDQAYWRDKRRSEETRDAARKRYKRNRTKILAKLKKKRKLEKKLARKEAMSSIPTSGRGLRRKVLIDNEKVVD